MIRYILAATVVFCMFASSAEARSRHHHHHHHHHYSYRHHHHHYAMRHHHRYASHRYHDAARSVYHARGGRPRAWCGWYMRGQVGADPGPSYNLARSWAHYGHDAGGPSVGAIVVWRHHVGRIVGRENGRWIVQSGNDGHAVRTRARSIAGAIAFRRA
jgi:hypothetical protein